MGLIKWTGYVLAATLVLAVISSLGIVFGGLVIAGFVLFSFIATIWIIAALIKGVCED